jgi:RNA polymerase sigma factor (sigma-70 family)
MAAAGTGATDDQLVAAIRDGSDEALEALFLRYKDRIAAYVRGIVPDQGKAEDIVQETFISAMRSLRSTRRPIAFRPWIYQIARNACIDQLRRQKRAQEISIDSEAFNVQDEGRLSQSRPSTHSEVSQREDMHALRQAFGGLPDSQHDALVMRELEGLSYTEIASRMDVSPAAVESMLFRARRGLKDEYEEIATGERCRQMQPLIAAVAEGMGGARDRQVLARHVRFCVSCRREATAMGLRPFVTEALRRGRIKRALHKAASLFPIPPFLRRRGGADVPDASLAERLGARMQAPFVQLGVSGGPAAENAAGALSKAVAVVAAAALIGGGLVGKSSDDASASAQVPAGGATALSGPGQPPNAYLGGQAAPDPFGPAAGLVQSGQQTASGQTISTGQGGVPSGSANPLSPILGGGGLLGGGGNGGLLGGSPSSGSGSPSTGKIGDTVNRVLPQSVGGISVPQLPTGGSNSSDGTNVGKIIDDTVSKLPVKPPVVSKPKSPSTPSEPTPTPELPSVPSVPSVPQTPVTSPSLQGTNPVPDLHVQVTPPPVQIPTLPQLP